MSARIYLRSEKAGRLDLDTATLEQVSAALAANRVSSVELVSGYAHPRIRCEVPRHHRHKSERALRGETARCGAARREGSQALQRARALAGEQGIDRLLRDNRVLALVAPTTGPAWMIDLVNGDRSVGSSSTLAAVSGYPHLTVPMTKVEGLPIGLSFFAGARSEQELLSLDYTFEQALRGRAAATR